MPLIYTDDHPIEHSKLWSDESFWPQSRDRLDDWTDQGLLTKDESRQRLVTEVAQTRPGSIALKSESSDAESEIMLLARQLDAVASIRGEHDSYLAGE
ncbi:hypothetical protein MINTM020_01220 [Mycobacterium paraintracellulare]|uniref:hypothetical protein n=1 Tax=Mycobacterium paraintracellulare TaxID=1138383 RepID=UPI00193550DC|nr:hypothetical protein [Mycobacterium paraintracellulare]BCP08024.1 hypothetical protein MINTM020_01220 [Mycobacterium paraintracellulare]